MSLSKRKSDHRRYRSSKGHDWGEVWPCWYCSLQAIFDEDDLLERYLYMSIFEDVFGQTGKVDKDRVLDDGAFQKQFPILYEMMTGTPSIEGKRRRVCTLTLVCEDGMAKGGLKDRDRDLSLWVSAQSLGEVFTALEEALTARPVAWRRITDDRFKFQTRNRQS
jgi:hypothetical protein